MTVIRNENTRDDDTYQLIVEKFGDADLDVKCAIDYAFKRDEKMRRSALIASGVSEANPTHPHFPTYLKLAEDITVTREELKEDNYLNRDHLVRVTITDNTGP